MPTTSLASAPRWPDDFVMDDRRRTGLGRLDRETYLASLENEK